MKLALNHSSFNKYDKGLFLSEHRRCYNEIINYCNSLVYSGKLIPLRGSSKIDKNNVLSGILPEFGIYDIPSDKSTISNGSRQNLYEAQKIVAWLENNFETIVNLYKAKDTKLKTQDILSIITPFKAQSTLLTKLLKKSSLSKSISVGTVHTFQGAERKIIIFSSTYGSSEICSFIDSNKALMNVAVSRAKDSFLMFGSSNCLNGSKSSSSGLLKSCFTGKVSEIL